MKEIAGLKQKISFIGQQIHDDIAQTISSAFYKNLRIASTNQNKLELMHFLDERTRQMAYSEPGMIMYLGAADQYQNLKKLRYYTYPEKREYNGRVGTDYFDLEKSFQAYRLLYPATCVRPLDPENYNYFTEVRNAMLCQFCGEFPEDLEIDEVSDFKTNMDPLFTKAQKSVGLEENITFKVKNSTQWKLDTMQTNTELVLRDVHNKAIMNDEWQEPRHMAILAYGYTAFALSHLMEDKNVPFEKRRFLIEQTGRVLHHLAA